MIDWCKRHPILFMAGYLVFYLVCFGALEHFIKPEWIVHCFLDDWIPFCKYAVIPYFAWFVWVPATLFWLLFTQPRQEFWRLCLPLFGGMTLCVALCALIPNGVDLRPDSIPGNDFFTQVVRQLWGVDTDTNVWPSIHAFNSMTVALSYHRWAKAKPSTQRRVVVGGMHLLNLSILASTVLLRQHSVIDLFCGVALALVLDYVADYVTVHARVWIQQEA